MQLLLGEKWESEKDNREDFHLAFLKLFPMTSEESSILKQLVLLVLLSL